MKQRGECFSTLNKRRRLKINIAISKNILDDFNNRIFNATKPVLQAQGKVISETLWNEIINNFTEITFIQIGSKHSDYEFNQDNVIDLRDRPITQSLSLIPASKFVLGTDNVLNHASKCFRKKGIFFWGSNDPHQYGYKQNINLYNPPDCSPCLHNRTGSKSYCCQHPHIDTISIKEIIKEIKNLLKETT